MDFVMPRIKKIVIPALFAMLVVTGGCRTSQQTRRNAAANGRNGTAAQMSGRQMDSLVMVQDKLLTIIDTMAGIVAQDRARIRSLELEIAKLRSLIEQQNMGNPIPPSAPPVNAPLQNYTSPPPQRDGMVPLVPPSQSAQPTSYPPNDRYNTALKYFNDGRYMDALTSFDELSRVDAQSQYAPNYLYWKGESLYALGQYDEAIRTFHDVLNKYPQSGKADDAEFKIGASYEKLGDKRNARMAYDRLVLSYPQSEYRTRAEARVNKLK
jgi:tol-pal system protein YbgF